MITNSGKEITRNSICEFYAKDLNGRMVLTRLIKKKHWVITFRDSLGNTHVIPAHCKFDVAICGPDGKNKRYKTYTLSGLANLIKNACLSKVYILAANSSDLGITIESDLEEKEIIWPETQFDFIDNGLIIRQ